ncbi:MAG: hypothetical protein ACREND_12160 [Gemmatimonadaceae bacterium]
MPITYSVDTSRDIIFETWTGTINASDLAAYWREYLADPEVMKCRRTLVDLRAATIVFTGQQLADLIESIAVPMLGGLKWATAVLVAAPAQFGTARQYQVFAESYSDDAIFFDEKSALEWLERQHPDNRS